MLLAGLELSILSRGVRCAARSNTTPARRDSAAHDTLSELTWLPKRWTLSCTAWSFPEDEIDPVSWSAEWAVRGSSASTEEAGLDDARRLNGTVRIESSCTGDVPEASLVHQRFSQSSGSEEVVALAELIERTHESNPPSAVCLSRSARVDHGSTVLCPIGLKDLKRTKGDDKDDCNQADRACFLCDQN